MKIFLTKIAFILALMLAGTFCFSQKSPANASVIKVTKFKPPVVSTVLGINGNGATITGDEANQLITLPLKITDASKNIYAIDSYQFLYKRKSTVEDEGGRRQVVFTTVADVFRTSPLPKIWIDNIQNGFQKSEELYFFDVVVKDKAGRKFFAPDLKLTIQ